MTIRSMTVFLTVVWGFAVIPISAQDTTLSEKPSISGILVDFQDIDLRMVITALAEAGGINVAYADLPARKVTLRIKQPVRRENILPLMRTLVQSQGLKTIEEGDIVRITQATTPVEAEESNSKNPEIRLFVYRLKHVHATPLSITLQTIFGAQRSSLPRQLQNHQNPTVPDSLDVWKFLDTQKPPAGQTLPSSLPAQLQGEVQIVPDETTNSLLIRSSPTDWIIVRQAIEAMDLRPLQVLIEVLIAEVRHTRELSTGISASATRTSNGSTADSASLATQTPNDFLVRLARGGNLKIDLAINALASRGNVRILSRPVVQAENNKEAKILVGEQRPFVQVFRSLPTSDAVRDQIVQYREVGTSLTILPTINPDGYVNLRVAQEVSNATSEPGPVSGSPVISTREVSTHLFVRDGRTAVIGGLVARERGRTRSGIPLLSSIPGLGMLFGSTRHTNNNTELFIFLTPHIIRSDEDTERLRGRMESLSGTLQKEIEKDKQ